MEQQLLQEIQESLQKIDSPSDAYQLAKQEGIKLYLTGQLSKMMVINICTGLISGFVKATENSSK